MNYRTRKRQALWDSEVARSLARDRGELPICNLCNCPVGKDQAWDESHVADKPRIFGGTETGIAHTRCNRQHGASVIRPRVTKQKNVRARDTGAWRSTRPLPAGRRSAIKKQVGGNVIPRISLSEKISAMREKRRVGP